MNIDSLWNDLVTSIKLRVSIEIEVEGHLTTVSIKFKDFLLYGDPMSSVKYYFVIKKNNRTLNIF